MPIAERVRALDLPADQFVVIGSGVLDVLGLREAGDIDLVASADLFSQIVTKPEWQISARHGELVAVKDDAEMFLSWGSEGRPNFPDLYREALVVDEIRYAHPKFVSSWKQTRGSEKDLNDVELLKEYLS